MKIKPIFFILLFLIFSASGCVKDSDETSENKEETAKENTEETTEKPSKSLNHNYHIDFGIVDFLLQ